MCRMASEGVHAHAATSIWTCACKFACVETTPFGLPVVPLVKMMRASSSSRTAAASTLGGSGGTPLVVGWAVAGLASWERSRKARDSDSATSIIVGTNAPDASVSSASDSVIA
jgi:Fe-S oxidoreductase